MQKAIICDLDGTLSLNHGRSFFDATTCDQDHLNEPVAAVIRWALEDGIKVIYLSGREFVYVEPTERFLKKHNLHGCDLFMRVAGDNRKDSIIKRELYDAYVVPQNLDILFVLDDRNQMVDMWRALGLTCFQVAPGVFNKKGTKPICL
jgi:hydroxymethylpyrimidine pyrophosphatase-like HAD family hydrolase